MDNMTSAYVLSLHSSYKMQKINRELTQVEQEVQAAQIEFNISKFISDVQ